MIGLPESKEKRVFNNVLGAMGNTPLVKLERIGKDLPVPLYAKLEFMNPGGSVKDRVGANIIEQAEKGERSSQAGRSSKPLQGIQAWVLPLPRR